MRLTVDHEDSVLIMNYLYNHCEVYGDEVELKDELLTDFLGKHDIWGIEKMLSGKYDDVISLPKDLRLIEES